MATRDFEVQQLLKAYRKGLISDEVFVAQMQEVEESPGELDVANVLGHRGDGAKVTARVSGKEQDLKAGDLLMIPAGAPPTLRTGNESMFGLTVFAPPEA